MITIEIKLIQALDIILNAKCQMDCRETVGAETQLWGLVLQIVGLMAPSTGSYVQYSCGEGKKKVVYFSVITYYIWLKHFV